MLMLFPRYCFALQLSPPSNEVDRTVKRKINFVSKYRLESLKQNIGCGGELMPMLRPQCKFCLRFIKAKSI